MYEENKSIPWLALVGAFFGTIPGIIVWAIAGSFGVTWALLGALIVAGAFLAYVKVCEHTNGSTESVPGLVGCIIICLIAVYIGVHFAWAGMIHNAVKDTDYALSLGECAARLYELLDLLELKGKFVGGVLKGYLFSALGAFGIFSKAGRR